MVVLAANPALSTEESSVRWRPLCCSVVQVDPSVLTWEDSSHHDTNDELSIKAHLAELERQHKALEHELAEALAHSSTDDLKIMELKRRKLILKDEVERVRHDHAF